MTITPTPKDKKNFYFGCTQCGNRWQIEAKAVHLKELPKENHVFNIPGCPDCGGRAFKVKPPKKSLVTSKIGNSDNSFEKPESIVTPTPDKLAEARRFLAQWKIEIGILFGGVRQVDLSDIRNLTCLQNKVEKMIDSFLIFQDLVSRAEQKKEILEVISKAYYIDKNFNLDDLENLKSLEGDIVLAWPSETKEIVTLWCDAQNSLTPNKNP